MKVEKEWLISEIVTEIDASNSYEEKALLKEALILVQEQYQRIEQSEGQLDGSLWSPKDW